MKSHDNLNEIFDVEHVVEGEIITASNNQVVLPETKVQNEKIEYDYDKSRNNLHTLLSQGQEALAYALELAKQSEHPRAFEVVGNLVSQLADINQQLLELHTKKQKLDNPNVKDKDSSGDTKNVTNNNAIFVGTTAELDKLISDMNKGN